MYEILRYLKNEIEDAKHRILFETAGNSTELVSQYNYRIGHMHALLQVQDWVKELEAKKMQQDLE